MKFRFSLFIFISNLASASGAEVIDQCESRTVEIIEARAYQNKRCTRHRNPSGCVGTRYTSINPERKMIIRRGGLNGNRIYLSNSVDGRRSGEIVTSYEAFESTIGHIKDAAENERLENTIIGAATLFTLPIPSTFALKAVAQVSKAKKVHSYSKKYVEKIRRKYHGPDEARPDYTVMQIAEDTSLAISPQHAKRAQELGSKYYRNSSREAQISSRVTTLSAKSLNRSAAATVSTGALLGSSTDLFSNHETSTRELIEHSSTEVLSSVRTLGDVLNQLQNDSGPCVTTIYSRTKMFADNQQRPYNPKLTATGHLMSKSVSNAIKIKDNPKSIDTTWIDGFTSSRSNSVQNQDI